MGRHKDTFYHSFAPFGRYFVDASVVAGQVLIRSTATNSAGEVVDPAAAAGADVLGLASTAVTYSATQADFGEVTRHPEGTVGILVDPFAIMDFNISADASPGTAFNGTAPAHILTNTVASATGVLVTAAEVGTITFTGGLMIGYTGANKGHIRRLSAHTDNTSTTVEVPYPHPLAVGDQLIRLPFSKASLAVDLTTALTEVNGVAEVGVAAGPWRVVDVLFNLREPSAVLRMIAADHFFNASA